MTKTGDTYEAVNPKHCSRALTLIDVYKCHSTSGRRTTMGDIRICTLRVLSARLAYMHHWYVIVVIIQSRLYVKCTCKFFLPLLPHKRKIVFLCCRGFFHAVEKNEKVKYFFFISGEVNFTSSMAKEVNGFEHDFEN